MTCDPLCGWDCNVLHRSQFASDLQTQQLSALHARFISDSKSLQQVQYHAA